MIFINIKNSMSYWNHIDINPPKNFIFGFGSIVNDESRKSTVENSGDPIPVRISPQFGYRRVWNFRSPTAKLTALGLEKVNDPTKLTTINGIIYPLISLDTNHTDDQMKAFDEREEGYVRMEIPPNLIEPTSWQSLPSHKHTVWIYVPIGTPNNKGERLPGENLSPPDKYYPILQSYVDVVVLGFLKYGMDFAIEFLYTTGWWSRYWLNDRQVPRRPWLYQKKYKQIDNLLMEYSKKYGLKDTQYLPLDIYKLRKLPEEYSIYFAHEMQDEKLKINQHEDVETIISDCYKDNGCTDLCFPLHLNN